MKVFGVCFVIFNFFLSSLESKVISDAAENKDSDHVAEIETIPTGNETSSKDLLQENRGGYQDLWCYDRTNYGGDSLHLIAQTPKFYNYNFNNRAESCCATGMWILYPDTYYRTNSWTPKSYYLYGNNYCTNLAWDYRNKASSARFVGHPNGYKLSAINIFRNREYAGEMVRCYNGGCQYFTKNGYTDRIGNSLILNGCQPWTIYTGTYYSGSALCLVPPSNCNPVLFSNFNRFSYYTGNVASARPGCYSSNKIYC